MRRKRSHTETQSSCTGVSSAPCHVRAVQSTQLDVVRLERELQLLSSSTPRTAHHQVGNGDVLSCTKLRKTAARLRRQGTTSTPVAENTLEWKSPSSLDEGKAWISSERATHSTDEPLDCSSTCVKPQGCCHLDPGKTLPSTATCVLRLVPVASECVGGQLPRSDNTNANAGQSCSRHRLLNRDNSAKSSASKAKAGPGRKRRNSRVYKRQAATADDNQGVIKLPPNSILKITSQSSLKVHKPQGKGETNKQRSQSPAPSKVRRTRSSPRQNISRCRTAKRGFTLSSQKAHQSGSSRYRVTPCPFSTTKCTSAGSLISPTSRSSGLTSRIRMKRRPSSAKLVGRFSGKSTIGSMTEDDSLPSRRSHSKRKRATSLSRSKSSGAFSRHSTSPRRRRSQRHRSLGSLSRGASLSARLSSCTPSRGSSPRRRLNVMSMGRRRRRAASNKASSIRRRRGPSGRARSKSGRPRGRPRARSSLTEMVSEKKKSMGLFDRVSSLWRSYSFSRAPSAGRLAATNGQNSSSCTSCSSSSQSWVSRMLPVPRGGKRREKPYKRGRAHGSRSKGSRGGRGDGHRKQRGHEGSGAGSKKEKAANGSGVCAIM